MDLHVLLSDFVKSKGRDILASPLLCNMMDDELMFRPFEHRDYKLLFRLMVKEGYVKSIFELAAWDKVSVENIKAQITKVYKGIADVGYALDCIGYATGHLSSVAEPIDVTGATPINQQVSLGEKEVRYIAHGSTKCIGTMIPASMVEPIHRHLNEIAKEEGSVAEFVMQELKINSQEELESKLSGEQIDGVALAIRQMQNGKGFIIGDMTGVGKGRQVAALLYWAILQGTRPVFVTEKSSLFSDLYRDLKDIGYGHLRPFILNSDPEAKILDTFGNVVYNRPKAIEIEDFKATMSLPSGYDFLLLTYSQLSREAGKNWKADCVKSIVKDSFIIMDESHNATGSDSNIGNFFREAVTLAAGVCFASATYAKYPSSMPVYALKTAMGDANIPAAQLIEIIESGGPILQEVMAKALVESGSMIRRQRDMSEVTRTIYKVSNQSDIDKMRASYDHIIELLEDVYNYQSSFIEPYLKSIDALGFIQKTHKIPKSETFDVKESKVLFQKFSNRMTPLIRQLLFAIKTEEAVESTLALLKMERKPIVQINRTMESVVSKLLAVGSSYDNIDFARIITVYLDDMFSFKVKGVTISGSGKTKRKKVYLSEAKFDFSDLQKFYGCDVAENEYHSLLHRIKSAAIELPVSPIDYFIQRVENAGYKVGELTNRSKSYIYDDVTAGVRSSGRYELRAKVQKKRLASDFNNGKIDVLIGNRVMASGISLHNSPDFADKRPRVVITWEQQDSADRQTQFDGRADRTGQLSHCSFVTLFSPIPAEHRYMMMHERKQRSLNANVEANQDSKDPSFVDIINKYGSQIVKEYLYDHPEQSYLFEFKENWYNKDDNYIITEFLRGLALLPSQEQEDILTDVMSRYLALIHQLDEEGTNDLKNCALPLNATLINRSVFFNGKKRSSSIFSQDATLDEVEMNILKKPMSATQITMLMSALKDRSYLVPLIDSHFAHKENAIHNRYNVLSKSINDKIASLQKLPPSQLVFGKIEKLKDRLSAYGVGRSISIMAKKEDKSGILSMLKWFTPGQSVGIPMSLEADSQIDDPKNIDYVSVGIFLGFRLTRPEPTRSSIKAVFAVNDYRSKIELPLTAEEKLRTIHAQTSLGILSTMLSSTNLSTWDTVVGNKTRTRGYIVTGNILLGLAMSRHFGDNIRDCKERQIAMTKGRGQLVTYTDDHGGIHHGYLMPPIFRNGDQIKYLKA